MRRFLIILMVIAGLYRLPAQDIVVMTYNIRYDNPGDGINAWNNRKTALAAQVLRESPDLLGIQEGLHHQVQDLASLLPGYSYTGVGRDDGDTTGEYAAIFYRTSRFEKLEGKTFWLSKTPQTPGSMDWETACTRIVTWARFRDNVTGKDLVHYNTHFDHMSEKARIRSAKLLLKRTRRCGKGAYPLVTGDFNCRMDEKPMRILTGRRSCLADSRGMASVRTGPEVTWTGFAVGGQEGARIDHILLPCGVSVQEYRVPDDQRDGRYLSDHLPVVIRFR